MDKEHLKYQATKFWKILSKKLKSLKSEMYPDLARELKNIWNMIVEVISVVMGVFGTLRNLEALLERIGTETKICRSPKNCHHLLYVDCPKCSGVATSLVDTESQRQNFHCLCQCATPT